MPIAVHRSHHLAPPRPRWGWTGSPCSTNDEKTAATPPQKDSSRT